MTTMEVNKIVNEVDKLYEHGLLVWLRLRCAWVVQVMTAGLVPLNTIL